MKKIHTRLLLLICAVLLSVQMYGITTRAQQQQQQQQQQQAPQPAPTPEQKGQADDVVRITTELIQTDVSVFDKQGRFVEGLKKEDFELRVDDKPVPIDFFERVAAGATSEEAQQSAARGGSSTSSSTDTSTNRSINKTVVRNLERGRFVAFFVDDMHTSAGNLKRVKDTIARYIDKEMGQNDLVAITSASGQIGFLQQYTDNKEVLKAALARLVYKNYDTNDGQLPPLSAYAALQVDRGDSETLRYLVDETMRQGLAPANRMTPEMAETIVRERVSFILRQEARTSTIVLSTLESLVRSSAPLPGRKLIFLISDGFFLDTRTGNMTEKMRSITDASTRSGVVIYSMDAKGLVTGVEDPALGEGFDPQGRASRSFGGELSSTQDTLNAIAVDTGGRFIRNTNLLDPALTSVLKETSVYYLLAWRPATATQRGGKFYRIEVAVKNRPELSVRVQRGFFDTVPEEKKKKGKGGKSKKPPDPLLKALEARFPQRELPTELTLSYMDTTLGGVKLVASMKIDGSSVRFERVEGKPGAVIDIEGAIFDAYGKQLDGFRQRLVTPSPPPNVAVPKLSDVAYNHFSTLKPGLYQVRVAARDDANGRVGSAMQWIEIPDMTKPQLSMSSLLVGERKSSAADEEKEEAPVVTVPLSVDRRFSRSSRLRFLVYIYNATRGAAAANAQPDVALQVQIFQGDRPVFITGLRKLSTVAQDLARLAYAAEIPLDTMTAGNYVLQVTAIDRITQKSASQRIKFEVQ